MIDNSWIHRDWGSLQRSGFDVTSVGIKWEDYRNNLHETLVAASLMWGMGRSGAQGVGANAPDLIKPGIFFGQGFGDLPESLFWLRPLGITGAVVVTHPTGSVSTNFGADPLRGRVGPLPADWVDTVQWGFAIEYNTLYLSKSVGNGLPKEEPLNQFVPLVEFFVRGRAWQANQCNDESWYLLCRNDMAACGRGDSATQSGGWARHRGQDAAPVVS